MTHTLEDVKVRRETMRIWQGIALAVFGCLLGLVGVAIPPVGVIDGSILTMVGEVFALSGASWGFFSYNRRDSAKINRIYEYIQNNGLNNTENGELSETQTYNT